MYFSDPNNWKEPQICSCSFSYIWTLHSSYLKYPLINYKEIFFGEREINRKEKERKKKRERNKERERGRERDK